MEKEILRVFERNLRLNSTQEAVLNRRIDQAGFIYNIMLERCREIGTSQVTREELFSFYTGRINLKLLKDPSSIPDYIVNPVTFDNYLGELPKECNIRYSYESCFSKT